MIYLILILGLILRLIFLNQSFWLDEATTANVAAMNVKEILTNFSPGDFHPPLYYLITHFWANFFGISEVSLRTVSVLAGLGTIYVLYLIGKELVGRKSGIVAGLLLATSGLHIYYSQEARMYSLATLFVSLTILFFVKTLKKGGVGDWILFFVFLTLSVFTDYLPVLIIPALWFYAWLKKLKPSWWGKFFTSHIILIGAGLLWLPTFIKQLGSGLTVKSYSPFWWQILGQANFKQLVLIPTKFIFGRINMEINPEQILIVAVVFGFFGYLLFRTLREFRETKLLWLWIALPLVLGVIISFRIPTLTYFRFLFILPAFYLLVATGLLNLPKKIFNLSLGAVVIFNLTTSGLYLFNKSNHRENWRGLTEFIKQESTDKKSAVVFVAGSQQEAYRYYDKNARILTPETIDNSYRQLWLMRYVQDVFDPEDKVKSKIESPGFRKIKEYDFNGVIVWKYEK